MKRIIVLVVSLGLITSVHSQFLRVKGTRIVNEKGDTVLLRGMGLGGWMLQEGYMFRLSNIGQQYRIREKITEVVGPEKAAEFYDRWLKNHCTRRDIDSLAAWGFNSVRLPMHYDLFTLPIDKEPVAGRQTWLQKGFDLTDSLLAWCRARQMYLILDLHATPGGQGNDLPISDRDPSKPSLWESEANQQKTIALWRKLAERYAAEPYIGGYDIINEPNWGFEDPKKDFRGTEEKKNEPLRRLMMDITKAIREVDQKHIIIIEGNGFGNNYRGVMPAWDRNMVLSFHKYGNFNTIAQINGFLELRSKYQVPLWLGESGENFNTWFTEAIGLAEQNGIGWAWWQMKKMGINNPLEIKRPDGYEQLLNYWSGKGEKPSADAAWATLQQLLDNLLVENNIFHPDVVDAMFWQVQTTQTRPFKLHVLTDSLTVRATDFDLGRQRYAYYDADSARYQYTPGVNTDGNRGRTYRNDGVDIQRSPGGPVVFSIEDGEWVQYTIDVKKAGRYAVTYGVYSDSTEAQLIMMKGNTNISPVTTVMPAGKWTVTSPVEVSLQSGMQPLRIFFRKGGGMLSTIHFNKID